MRELLRNILRMMAGISLGEIILLLSLPILTRLYGGDAFALLAVIAASSSILTPLVTLRYDDAILTTRYERAVRDLIALNLIVMLLTSFLLFILVTFLSLIDFHKFLRMEHSFYLFLIPISTFFRGLVYALLRLCIWRKRFYFAGLSRVLLGLTTIITQISLLFAGMTYNGLALGFTAGLIISALFLLYDARHILIQSVQEIKLTRLIATAHRHRDFARFTCPGNIINYAGNQVQNLGFIALFGQQVGSSYFLATKVVSIPLRSVGAAIVSVFWSDATNLYRDNPVELKRRFLLLTAGLAVIGLPLFILLPFGGTLFSWLLGDKWAMAGVFAGVIWCSGYVMFIVNCLGSLNMYGKNNWMSFWEVSRLTLILVIFIYIKASEISVFSSLWILVLLGGLIPYLILYFLNYYAIMQRIKKYQQDKISCTESRL